MPVQTGIQQGFLDSGFRRNDDPLCNVLAGHCPLVVRFDNARSEWQITYGYPETSCSWLEETA